MTLKKFSHIKKFCNWLWAPKINFIAQIIFFLPFIPIMFMMLIHHEWIDKLLPKWTFLALGGWSSILVFVIALKYFHAYYLVSKKQFSMNLLIAIAVHTTYFYSLIMTIFTLVNSGYDKLKLYFWETPSTLLTFISLGQYLENKLMKKTSLGIKELLLLQNQTAQLINDDGSVISVDAHTLKVGDRILIHKGQSSPIDGLIIANSTQLDVSYITGESLPQDVYPGNEIISGSINLTNTITVQVNKLFINSTLNQIINQLENLVDNQSKIQRFSEKVVKYFIPTVLIIAVISFLVWIITLSQVHPQEMWKRSVLIGVTVIVIACPCAFGIAAPAAIYAAAGIAAKNKILFANADVYEKLDHAKYIIFDKTGTLTLNQPKIQKIIGQKSYVKIAQSLAQKSYHPLSQIIAENATDLVTISEIKEEVGYGLIGQYRNDTYELGSYLAMQKKHYQASVTLQKLGPYSYVALAKNQQIVLVYQIADQLKPDAHKIIQKFHEQNLNLIIASGDNQKMVAEIAKQLQITDYYGQLSPQDKLALIAQYQKKGPTIFVGDGLNDVLAIKQATLGIAFASGSDLVNDYADVSLMSHEISGVYQAIYLAKKTLKTIKLNFAWAFIFNLLAIPLAISGVMSFFPSLAAILMIVSNILLLANTWYFKNSITKKIRQIIQ